MDDLKRLVSQGHLLVSYALTHNIALTDPVRTTLSNADADALANQAVERDAFLAAFAEAGRVIGISVADIGALAARNARLRPLVDAARTLLNFAAANGRKVEEEARNALVATEAAVEAGTTTLAQEQAFLKAYEDLTAALAPITVETLDASTTKLPSFVDIWNRKGADKPPMWTLGRFVNATIFILVLVGTGISLAYYSVGASALGKFRELQASVTSLKQKEAEANRDVTAKELALNQLVQKAKDNAANVPAGQVDGAAALLAKSKAELATIQDQEAAVNAELKAIPERLGRWAMQPCVSQNVIFNAALCAGVNAPDPALANRRMAAAAAARAASSAAGPVAVPALLPGTLVDVEAARTVVSRMSDVYLPLLLGFLGAHAFILRRMSKEISERTFAKGSAFNHIVRTGLGALASRPGVDLAANARKRWRGFAKGPANLRACFCRGLWHRAGVRVHGPDHFGVHDSGEVSAETADDYPAASQREQPVAP